MVRIEQPYKREYSRKTLENGSANVFACDVCIELKECVVGEVVGEKTVDVDDENSQSSS